MNGASAAHSGYKTAKLQAILIALAVGLGISIAYEPLFIVITFVGAAVILLSVLSPQRICYLLLISSAISVQNLYEGTVAGFDMLSLHKLAIIMLAVPAALRYGIYGKYTMPVTVLGIMLGYTYVLADRPPLLGMIDPVASFIGLVSPFVLLLIRWPKSAADKIVNIVCILPLVSLLAGMVLEVAGLGSLLMLEFTGATRLAGANIPPHLAFLAFMGVAAAIIEAKRRPDRVFYYYVLMTVNFLILLLTGTRGAMIAVMLMIFVFLYDLSKQYLQGRTALILPLFGFVAVLVSAVWMQLDNLMKRSFERKTDSGFDFSGRLEAWEYFLKGAEGSPWFGQGLGSVLMANDGSLYEGFMVPHNEYIRFYYDGGIIGAILLFAALIYVLRIVIRNTTKELRLYMTALAFSFLIYSISDNTLSTLQFILPFCVYLNASGVLPAADKERSL